MRQLVLPAFANFTLREISVRRVDQFIKRLAASKSYSKAKHARTVLSLACGLAVRYDALRENPVRETTRLRPPPSQAMALTVLQVEAIRHAVRAWRSDAGLCGPRSDGQLEQIIEVMLGTSARIGEVLAIRKGDVDVTCSPATVRIRGTIVSPSGKPTQRQSAPTTAKSTRTVSVPTFTVEVLREKTREERFPISPSASRSGGSRRAPGEPSARCRAVSAGLSMNAATRDQESPAPASVASK